MTAQHRSDPPTPILPRRGMRGARLHAGSLRSGVAQPGLGRLRALPGPVPGGTLAPTAANDNRPTLRWRLTRLAASLGILAVGGAIVVIFDS